MVRTPFDASRREFLKKTSVAVAAPVAITSTALGAPGKAAASQRITTALIGSGGRGQQIIVGGDQVVAVCDVDTKLRDKAKAAIEARSGGSVRPYDDFRDVLARDDIDAVVVATPDHWHVPIAIAAIKAGKAVYVEKPLSLTIRQGQILTDVAHRYGAIAQVGSQQRSVEYVKFLRACELVRNGRIGDVEKVEVEILARPGNDQVYRPRPVPPELNYDMWLGPAPWSPYHPNRVHYKFRFVTDFSGGDVTNWGAHHLDITQLGLGMDGSGPVAVEGHGKRLPSGIHDTFYDVHVDFTYDNGVKVELRSKESGVKTGHVRFVGSDGWVQVSREAISAEPESLLTSRIEPGELHLVPENVSGTHMGNWLDCVRSRSVRGLNAPVAIGHRSATLCHLANIVMELGRKLQWDPVKEEFVDDDEANRMRSRPARPPWQI